MAFRLDRSDIAPPVRRADGSVVYEGPVTRTGVFKYTQPDGSVRREYRPPAEVGAKACLDSLELAHVCDDHPAERGQAKGKSVGTVGAVRFDGRLVIAKVMVRDDAVNAKIANGKSQLSCGYNCQLVETPGTSPDGERYDAIQTNLDNEHVAIVAAGRAGPEVRLRLDALEADDRDDAGFRVGGAGSASVSVTSTSLSGVELDAAVAAAIAKIPGAYVDTSNSDRADAATAVQAQPWRAPSVWVSSRDLSLDDLSSQLAAAMGPGVTVKRGDAASTTTRQDTAAMKNCDTCGAPVNDAGKFAKDHADHAGLSAQLVAALAEVATVKADAAAQKTRADKAEGERDAAKDRADAADKARKDAVDQGPSLARARVKLEDKATAVLGAEFKVDGKSDIELQRAVTEKLLGKALPADASPVYVAARYDAAIETIAAAGQHVDAARGTGTGTGGGAEPTEIEMQRAMRAADAARSKTTAAA